MYLWYGAFLFSLVASMLLLMKATQTLPLGTAYAVWTGIGAVGTASWASWYLMSLLISGDSSLLSH